MDIIFDCRYVKQVVNNVTLLLGYQPRMIKIKRIKSKSKHGVVMSQQKQNEKFVGIEGRHCQKLFNLSKKQMKGPKLLSL